MKSFALATLIIAVFLPVVYANDVIRMNDLGDFLNIHETRSDATDILKKSLIQSLAIRRQGDSWVVYLTTSEIGPINDEGSSYSNRIYQYRFLTQSRAEDFARQVLELVREVEPKR